MENAANTGKATSDSSVEKFRVIIPEEMELTEADKEVVRKQLETRQVDTLEGTRANIVFDKEQSKVQEKAETAKEKALPIEKAKLQ